MSSDRALRSACVAVATGFYLSYIPVKLIKLFRVPGASEKWTGAGFTGTLIGWATLHVLPSEPTMMAAALAAGILGASWVSAAAEREFGTHDDSRIVIDEIVGYWVTMAWLPRGLWVAAAGFVLFRFFDAVKLPPYRWLERLPGGYGIVMDDVGAGIVANILLSVLQPHLPA